MTTGLIGYTGFVGGNISEQHTFDFLFNTKNIKEIRWKHFDLLVCAWVKAVKWYANQNSEEDWQNIESLLEMLKTVTADRFILISTIDIYPELIWNDEDYSGFDKQTQPYGAHRFMFENFAKAHFPKSHIIRLPGLFGNGIKKNVIYDLLHDNQLENIDPGARIQYYPLDRIWQDIETTVKNNIPVVNFFASPIVSEDIIERFFLDKKYLITRAPTETIRYDLRTKYAMLYGWKDWYILGYDDIIAYMDAFIKREQQNLDHE